MPVGVYVRTPEARRNIGLAAKGRPAWNKGLTGWMGEEQRKNVIAARTGTPPGNKGKHHTAEARAKMSAAGMGREPWNKGVPCSEETKKKVSIARKGIGIGRKHSEEAKARMREAIRIRKENGYRPVRRGEKHHNWKGGITPRNRSERQRFRQELQRQVLERDNYTCQICEQYSGSLQVDHIKKWADDESLRFDIDNCRTLCMGCHYYVTFKRKLPKGVVWGHNLCRRVA